MRHTVLSALLAASAAVTVTTAATPQQVANTQKQVTVVMRNGERHTGTLVYHNDSNLNLIENGQERPYSMDNMVLVDFVGGDPSADELNRLQTTINARDVNQHMLALRGGRDVHGRMYTITPTAITFNTPRGHQDFPLDSVMRWYLSPSAARQMYASILSAAPPPAAAPPPSTAPEPTQPPAGQPAPPGAIGAITVNANRPWTDTGINVKRGDRLTFSTTGQVAIRQNTTDTVGPDGSATDSRAGAPIPTIGVGGLIGRVANGPPFAIGSASTPIVMPANGRLFLGVNDAGVSDNSGAFVVTIVR